MDINKKPVKIKYQSVNNLNEIIEKEQVLIDRFADLMIERLFQDLDTEKKLYTKK